MQPQNPKKKEIYQLQIKEYLNNEAHKIFLPIKKWNSNKIKFTLAKVPENINKGTRKRKERAFIFQGKNSRRKKRYQLMIR